ncbi:MAG: DUF4349 domain-containing protein [Lachnospiraceae bacterium]|nr:DUF4349 domain-containing protein [Lachnospiraceae bacterium]
MWNKIKKVMFVMLVCLLFSACAGGGNVAMDAEPDIVMWDGRGEGDALERTVASNVLGFGAVEMAELENESWDDMSGYAQPVPPIGEIDPELIDGGATSDAFLIHRAFAEMITTDFDHAIVALNELIEQHEGFIESSNINTENRQQHDRRASFSVRVPSMRYQAFLDSVGDVGTLTSINTNVTNVTAQFADLDSRLNSLRAQEERLLLLVDEAQNMEDLISLEFHLGEVIRQIEWLTTDRNHLESQVNFSTVDVSIREVTAAEEGRVDLFGNVGFSDIGGILNDSIRAMGTFGTWLVIIIVAALPWLLVGGIIAIIVIVCVKHRIKKRRLKKEKQLK